MSNLGMEKRRLGNGVKNLSGSVDIPKLLILIITKKEMLAFVTSVLAR